MGTQVYMEPEYMRGELSMKVDSFAFGLVVLETLTGLPVYSPAPGHRNLLKVAFNVQATRTWTIPQSF
jgi:serine/threonine protein kinase